MKKNLKLSLAPLLLLLTPSHIYAMDFLEAYELAEQRDPEIRAAEFDYEAVVNTRPQVRAALLPNLTLDVFAQQTEEDSNAVISNGDYDADGYSVSLVQSVYQHDLYLRLEQADMDIASAAATLSAARQDLILRVADAYYNVLGAGDNLAFAEAEKKAIGEQLEQTQRRFDVGLIAITDVKESQAQYDVAVAQEIEAINLLATNRETLRSIIGEMPDTLKILAEEFPLLVPEPANIDEWVETAKLNNLTLKVAQYNFDIAKQQVSIDLAGHYPSVNLTVTHDDTETDFDNTTTNIEREDTSIILNLSVPIYSGGLTTARTRTAISVQESARALREKALRDVVKLGRDSYLGVTTSIAQVKAFKQALISTQTAYEATQAGFEVGTRTAVEVLAVLRNLYLAERDYARSRYQYILNILRLKQAAGILTKEDVVQVNRWLQN